MLWLRMKARGMGGEKKRRREGKLPGMQAAKITPHINQGEHNNSEKPEKREKTKD